PYRTRPRRACGSPWEPGSPFGPSKPPSTMNDTPPLTADQVDELLSADLDGEFDDAARDLGLDPADARARLANEVRGVDDRRAALAAARDALAEAPAVDDLLAARVRAKAMKAAASAHGDQQAYRPRRSRRLYAV